MRSKRIHVVAVAALLVASLIFGGANLAMAADNDTDGMNTELTVEVGDELETASVFLFNPNYEVEDEGTADGGQVTFDTVTDGEYLVEVYASDGSYVDTKSVTVDGSTVISIGTDEEFDRDGSTHDETDGGDDAENDERTDQMDTELIVEINDEYLETVSVFLFNSDYRLEDEATTADGQVTFDDVVDGEYYIEVYASDGTFVDGKSVAVDGSAVVSIGDNESDGDESTNDGDDADNDEEDVNDEYVDSSFDDSSSDGLTVETGDQVSLTLEAAAGEDPLAGAEWYVDGSFDSVTELDGDHDSTTWKRTFDEPGTYTVEAAAFDEAGTYQDGTSSLQVTVRSSDDDESQPEPSINAVYVWGYADEIVTDDDAAERFFERTEKYEYNTVYLSADVLYTASEDELAAFLRDASDREIDVEALVGFLGADGTEGAERYTEDVVEYNADRPSDEQFDGLHYDLEPESSEELEEFLSAYMTFIDDVPTFGSGGESVETQELTVAADIGWWWTADEPATTYELVDHTTFDYVSVMAYYDTTSEVRDRLSTVVSETDTPYVLAVETMQYPGEENHRASFYESGPDAMNGTIDAIESEPPSAEYLGTAHHYYGSSISSWDAIRDVDLGTSEATAGETVTLETTVLFDNAYPDSAQRSSLSAVFSGKDAIYETSVEVEPSAGDAKETTLAWTVPEDAPAGEYEVTIVLSDTTYIDENREAAGAREKPVTLDEQSAGTVEIDSAE